jgi:hypothetical protein
VLTSPAGILDKLLGVSRALQEDPKRALWERLREALGINCEIVNRASLELLREHDKEISELKEALSWYEHCRKVSEGSGQGPPGA